MPRGIEAKSITNATLVIANYLEKEVGLVRKPNIINN